MASSWLIRYFAGDSLPVSALPLAPAGTPFQQAVWQVLAEIPFGQLISYGALAERVSEKSGRHTSARAIGGAVGRNPLLIVIPCHRVIGKDGSLTGFSAGMPAKEWLLAHEHHNLSGGAVLS